MDKRTPLTPEDVARLTESPALADYFEAVVIALEKVPCGTWLPIDPVGYTGTKGPLTRWVETLHLGARQAQGSLTPTYRDAAQVGRAQAANRRAWASLGAWSCEDVDG